MRRRREGVLPCRHCELDCGFLLFPAAADGLLQRFFAGNVVVDVVLFVVKLW
jgi:hypothetical protein